MVADAAYAACLRIARQHYENFPVASRLAPAGSRRHLAAIYAFARIADDFADEGARSNEARLALLDNWHARLLAATRGEVVDDRSDAAAIFTALAATISACGLEITLFEDLLSAFRQDVSVTRYDTWPDLLDYCRRSANPVGRLVLRVSGYHDAQLDDWSDAVCTALQLTNFWQDLEQDWDKGRVYVPRDVLAAHGAGEATVGSKRMTRELRAALTDAASRTRALYRAGRPIASAVRGRLRWELRATWLGGVRILDRLEAAGFDVFESRPKLSAWDAVPMAWGALLWSRA